MQMLYNSESFVVVEFDVPTSQLGQVRDYNEQADSFSKDKTVLSRGGFEIVDKFACKETFIEGALAQSFKAGVEALILTRPSEEEIDDYIDRFSSLMQHPVVLH
jgi:Protein of unknown function (DUF3567)